MKYFHQVETKEIQTKLYKNEGCAKYLKEKQIKKKYSLL
jgi:hypothetical protein